MAPAYFVCVCVCGLCGTGISVSGASNISYMLYNYLNVALDENKHFTYLYWWDIVWITGENTIRNHEHLLHHQVGNPKTLTLRSADPHYGPGLRTTYGPVHRLPQRTPSTDHPPKYNKINK